MPLIETAESAFPTASGQPISTHTLPASLRPLTNRFHRLDGRSKAWRQVKLREAALRADFGQPIDHLAEQAIHRLAELMVLSDLFRTGALTGHANIETATRLASEVRRQEQALSAMRKTTPALTAADVAKARRHEAALARRRLKRREKAKAQANGNGTAAPGSAPDAPSQPR